MAGAKQGKSKRPRPKIDINHQLRKILDSWVLTASQQKKPEGLTAKIIVLGSEQKFKHIAEDFKKNVPKWQVERLFKDDKEVFSVAHLNGPVWLICPKQLQSKKQLTNRQNFQSSYAKYRNLIGDIYASFERQNIRAARQLQ